MPDDVLAEIHLEGELLHDVLKFDDVLEERLASFASVPGLDQDSPTTSIAKCVCPTCGKEHIAK